MEVLPMARNYVKNTLILALACLGLFSQTQGMHYLRRSIGANPVLKTRLSQPVLQKIGVHQLVNTVHYQKPRQSWGKRIAKWTTGAAFASATTAGVAAHHIHNLPDVKRYPTVSKILDYKPVQQALKWFPTFGRNLANYWKTNGIVKSFEQEMKEQDIDSNIKLECIQKWPKECRKDVSYSDLHISLCKPNINGLLNYINMKFEDHYVSRENICHIINSLLQEEKAYKRQNFYSFYHACKKEIYFYQLINTKLDELLTGKKAPFLILRDINAMPAHFIDDTVQIPLTNSENIREHLINHGVSNDTLEQYRPFLLSVNAPILGNAKVIDSCTMDYAVSNHNNKTILPPLSAEKQKIYDKYKKELEDLKVFINSELRGGIILHVGITEKLLDKCSYWSPAGLIGRKNSSINDTDKTTEILDLNNLLLNCKHHGGINVMSLILNNHTAIGGTLDCASEFRLVLTPDMLLNPYNEEVAKNVTIKAWSFDQKKLEEFHRRANELMEKIKHDMQSTKQ